MLDHSAGDEAIAVQALLDTFPSIGTKQSIQRKIERLKKSKPKKAKASKEYQDWLESPFISFCVSSAADGNVYSTSPEPKNSKGRPGKRLSESPCADTIKKILAPEIDRLRTIAEQQRVSFEYVIGLLTPKQSKKPKVNCTISKDEALAFFFNAGFSSCNFFC